MADLLLPIPNSPDASTRETLLDEIAYLAEKCGPLAQALSRDEAYESVRLVAMLDHAALRAGTDPAIRLDIDDDALLELLGMLTSLVFEGNHRCCSLDLGHRVEPAVHALLEPSALAIGHASGYAYSRWADRVGPARVGTIDHASRYALMDAIQRSVIDGVLHGIEHSVVPDWFQSELGRIIGRILDARDLPTDREYVAGPWSMKAAFVALNELAATWRSRATPRERAAFDRACSRSTNAALGSLGDALDVLPELVTFADTFALGHIYALAERVLNEIADATDTKHLNQLDAIAWFMLITLESPTTT